MKSAIITFIFFSLFSAIGAGCSDGGNPLSEINDVIYFTDLESKKIFTMSPDGENVNIFESVKNPQETWRSQRRILNSFCGGVSNPSQPIVVYSPDGALLGPLEDFWQPELSSDREWIAVSCGRDDNGNVVVVSNFDQQGSSDGWSRNGNGLLSDKMEIYIAKIDGSSVTRITSNEAGDWLPRWRPNRTQLIYESNRDGDSEIYTANIEDPNHYRLTQRPSRDQSPAWGENGLVATFSSDVDGNFEIRVIKIWDDLNANETNADSPTGQVGNPVADQK